MVHRDVILTRKTRKGAENYIKDIGFEPGVTAEDDRWTGGRSVPIWLTFSVEQVGQGRFDVVREWEDI